MRLIITTGTQTDDSYTESHRWEIDVTEDATIGKVLEQVKAECVPSVPALNSHYIKPHLYLMHPDTNSRLDEGMTVVDSGLANDSTLRLMSAVR